MVRIEGFSPYVPQNARLLILGSFPSVKSREVSFYYGNPMNRFWGILAEAFGEPLPLSTENKSSLLDKHGIALWDVVTSCNIVGSMDVDIKDPVIADVTSLVARHGITHVITNGKTAYNLLLRHHPDLVPMVTALPSTSPANTRLDRAIWIEALRKYAHG